MIFALNVIIWIMVGGLVTVGTVQLFSREKPSAGYAVVPPQLAPIGYVVTRAEYERDSEAVDDYFLGVIEMQHTTRQILKREALDNVVSIEDVRERKRRQRA